MTRARPILARPISAGRTLAGPIIAGLAAVALVSGPVLAQDKPGPAAAVTEEDGKWFAEDGTPTFKVDQGKVDWYTFSGFRRYNAECHVCHGPDGQGSSYAPALAQSVQTIDYYTFTDIVVNGKKEGNLVMPSFGTNKNIMCYLDDIYIYLRAVGSGEVPRGRPAARADKPASFTEAENACMG